MRKQPVPLEPECFTNILLRLGNPASGLLCLLDAALPHLQGVRACLRLAMNHVKQKRACEHALLPIDCCESRDVLLSGAPDEGAVGVVELVLLQRG